MPRISRKAEAMPPSPIRKLVPFAEAAKKRGTTVYHLNIGQPDIETPPGVIEAIRRADLRILEYTHSAGTEAYRRKLAGYYQRLDLPVTTEDLLVTTGGSEALAIAMMVCFNPGDAVVVPEPFYANYNSFACAADVSVRPVPARLEDGFALPPIEEFAARITPETRGILLCNPCNPTGYLYSREELERLKRLAVERNLFLIVDEVYREFCYDDRRHVGALSLGGAEGHTIVVDSVSKRYSACGARVGALVTKNREVLAAALKFAQARLSPPALGQIAAEAAVDTPKDYFDKVLREYAARRDFLVAALNRIPGVVCPKPSGAFYCMARLPVDDADAFCRWLLESFERRGRTVMLAPGSGFYATPGAGRHEARIAYVLKLDDLRGAVECLEAALQAYPGRTPAR